MEILARVVERVLSATELVECFGSITRGCSVWRCVNRRLTIHRGLHVFLLHHKTKLRSFDPSCRLPDLLPIGIGPSDDARAHPAKSNVRAKRLSRLPARLERLQAPLSANVRPAEQPASEARVTVGVWGRKPQPLPNAGDPDGNDSGASEAEGGTGEADQCLSDVSSPARTHTHAHACHSSPHGRESPISTQ